MTSSARQEAADALTFAKAAVEREFPGSTREFYPSRISEDLHAIGIYYDSGLTLIWADTTNRLDSSQWTLQISSGLRIDIPDINYPLRWANEKNRKLTVGMYYCAIAEAQGLCAVAYDTTIWGGLFTTFTRDVRERGGSIFGGWILGLIRNSIQTTAHDSKEIGTMYGGRPFADSDNDLIALFTIVSG